MNWEKIVEIQYEAMQRSSAIYIAILAAIAAFSRNLSLNYYIKISLILAFLFVLLQSLSILFLTNIQRKASWKNKQSQDPTKENLWENRIRGIVLYFSIFATASIFLTIALIIIFNL